jgi:hypothetical protein
MRPHLLTQDFIEVLKDLNALQCIRDLPRFTRGDVMLMADINNHTASIQSRLLGLSNPSPVQKCCCLAAYICSVMLCCTVWCALVIPVGEPQPLRFLALNSLAFVNKALFRWKRRDVRFIYYSDS